MSDTHFLDAAPSSRVALYEFTTGLASSPDRHNARTFLVGRVRHRELDALRTRPRHRCFGLTLRSRSCQHGPRAPTRIRWWHSHRRPARLRDSAVPTGLLPRTANPGTAS